jgi:hypothetical protein
VLVTHQGLSHILCGFGTQIARTRAGRKQSVPGPCTLAKCSLIAPNPERIWVVVLVLRVGSTTGPVPNPIFVYSKTHPLYTPTPLYTPPHQPKPCENVRNMLIHHLRCLQTQIWTNTHLTMTKYEIFLVFRNTTPSPTYTVTKSLPWSLHLFSSSCMMYLRMLLCF